MQGAKDMLNLGSDPDSLAAARRLDLGAQESCLVGSNRSGVDGGGTSGHREEEKHPSQCINVASWMQPPRTRAHITHIVHLSSGWVNGPDSPDKIHQSA